MRQSKAGNRKRDWETNERRHRYEYRMRIHEELNGVILRCVARVGGWWSPNPRHGSQFAGVH